MLQDRETMRTTDKQGWVSMLLRGEIAYDPDTGATLTPSAGRSRAGRGAWYVLAIPGQASHRFRALRDADALAHARTHLARLGVAPE